ncbi:nicotinamide riboside transporter PnuC [Mycoplasmopsis gallinacea]|uniref:Deoxynucleoside kinase n=1 Tax=Mycoplasmopsis gallinacea TaxID=29556 RepID=A0A6H0V228_9BACT|nr:nicotinamide riboside transporter PnuC [Mycoplasmopsis gallinacea]QIW62400.1 deoxynucleoside kinase [Mycoplasmopsis gallinacea]
MQKQILKNKNMKYFLIGLTFIFLTFLSLYSISDNTWAWQTGQLYQKILAIGSGLSGVFGLISTWYFYKRKALAFPFGIIHSLCFGLFCLSVNLTADFILTLFIFVPIFSTLWYSMVINKKVKMFILNIYSTIFFSIVFVIFFVLFYFVTPIVNLGWAKILNQESAEYGKNFNYYWTARIISTTINAVSAVALIMMILGFYQTWALWIVKNLLAIAFFSGIGFVSISVVVINVFYTCLSIYIFFKTKNIKPKILIAFGGPGATGKTTVINNLSSFFKENEFELLDETSFIQSTKQNEAYFVKYMEDIPQRAYQTQKLFFKYRRKQLYRMQLADSNYIIDRYPIDDMLFSEVHIKLGFFSKIQKIKWKIIEILTVLLLKSVKPLDHFFIITADYEEIKKEDKKEVDKINLEKLKLFQEMIDFLLK